MAAAKNSIQIYPNPVGDVCKMHFNKYYGGADFRILDISGKIVRTGYLNPGLEGSVDVSGLKPGSYIIVIGTADERLSGRFVKQ
jgi:hypothetical protein